MTETRMSEMKCCFCPSTLSDGPLHRINAKGQSGIWACAACRPLSDAPPVDSTVKTIVDAIDAENRRGK